MKNKVLKFWFSELSPSERFLKDSSIDEKISRIFLNTYYQATRGELFQWRDTIRGRLAEIIVLDQFSRNIFRDDKRAFEFDSVALVLSQEAAAHPESVSLTPEEKGFLYMPYMHSESLLIHKEAMKLFSEPGLEDNLEFEVKHKLIIEQFGRYPHRNILLGRESSIEEVDFLKKPGSSF